MRTGALIVAAVAVGSAEDKARAFVDAIEPMMGSGLVTLERVQVIRYGAPRAADPTTGETKQP